MWCGQGLFQRILCVGCCAVLKVYSKVDENGRHCSYCRVTETQLTKFGVDHESVVLTDELLGSLRELPGATIQSAPVVTRVNNDGSESYLWSGMQPDQIRLAKSGAFDLVAA